MALFRSRKNTIKFHKENTGKVYGSAVNNRRKRYCKDLATGTVHDSKGRVVTNSDGEIVELSKTQASWRSGYVEGVSDSSAAAKTAVGLDTRASHKGIQIESQAVMSAFKQPGRSLGKIKK